MNASVKKIKKAIRQSGVFDEIYATNLYRKTLQENTMNDHVTISTFQLFKLFPDEGSARTYLESRLWPDGIVCPVCGEKERITTRKDGYYRCNKCKEDFTVRTGSIFERSHIPVHKWSYGMYLLVTA